MLFFYNKKHLVISEMFFVAGPTGFEPAVFSVTGRRVNRATPRTLGGWGGFRTHYLGLMSPTLYRLSYPAESGFK